MRFVVVTGMSGAGKSQAIKCLEDMNFYCVDNMPPLLIPKLAEMCKTTGGAINNVAVVVDIRSGEMFKETEGMLNELELMGINAEILFLESTKQAIVRRYKETRRKHPLADDGRVEEGIEKELKILEHIKNKADYILDTSDLYGNHFKKALFNIINEGKASDGILIDVMSFGFKYGIPIDADLVFDVKFLPNPFYIEELKNHTGLDKDVQDYVNKWPQTKQFMDKLYDMITFLVPHYLEEGKTQLTIAIGCTGGMHRSVTMVESLYEKLNNSNFKVIKHHRDLEKDVRR